MAGNDLLLVTPLALWGYHLAEAAGCPLLVLSPIPIIATGDFAFLQFPGPVDPRPRRIGQRLKRRLNRFSYHSISLLKWRQAWGGARSRRDAPAQLANPTVLHLFSPRVLARPADWQESASVAGQRLPSLSAETLALSMGAIANNPSFRIRAQELQQTLGGEDGVANVVAAIEARLIAA